MGEAHVPNDSPDCSTHNQNLDDLDLQDKPPAEEQDYGFNDRALHGQLALDESRKQIFRQFSETFSSSYGDEGSSSTAALVHTAPLIPATTLS